MTHFVPPQKQVRELTPEERERVIQFKRAKFEARQAEARARAEEEAAEQLAELVIQFFSAPEVEELAKLEQRFGKNVPRRVNVVSETAVNNGWVAPKSGIVNVEKQKQDFSQKRFDGKRKHSNKKSSK